MPLSGVCFLSYRTIYFSRHQQFASTLLTEKTLDFRNRVGGALVVAFFIVYARDFFLFYCVAGILQKHTHTKQASYGLSQLLHGIFC